MEWLIGVYLQIAFFVVLPAVAYAVVFQKAGYSPWLGLLMLLPLVNLIVLIWFAASTWPLEMGYQSSLGSDLDAGKADTTWELKMAIRKGLSLESQGMLAEAIAQFKSVVKAAPGLPLGELAEKHVARIRAGLGDGK